MPTELTEAQKDLRRRKRFLEYQCLMAERQIKIEEMRLAEAESIRSRREAKAALEVLQEANEIRRRELREIHSIMSNSPGGGSLHRGTKGSLGNPINSEVI